jgi:hypothetical protein
LAIHGPRTRVVAAAKFAASSKWWHCVPCCHALRQWNADDEPTAAMISSSDGSQQHNANILPCHDGPSCCMAQADSTPERNNPT